MKKIIFTLTLTLLLCLFLSACAEKPPIGEAAITSTSPKKGNNQTESPQNSDGSTEEGSSGFTYKLTEDKSGYILASIEKAEEGDIVIPKTHEGLPVKAIGTSAFMKKNITSVKILAPIESIGENAFKECSKLTGVTFEDSSKLTSIGKSAFSECGSLKNITFSDKCGLTEIGNEAFSGCGQLQSFTLPADTPLKKIGYKVFYYCASLKEMILPDSLERIADGAFSMAYNLSKVYIPKSLDQKSAYAFFDCPLKEITVSPDAQNYSGSGNCLLNKDETVLYKGTATSKIPATVKEIGSGAFKRCRELTEITLPEGLTKIGGEAFYNCESLKRIEIPEGVENIQVGTFHSCKSLEYIKLPKSLTYIDETFMYCPNLKTVEIHKDNKLVYGDGTCIVCVFDFKEGKTLVFATEDTVIPEGVETIGYNAFFNAAGLKKIHIPASVKAIYGAFSQCPELSEVTFAEGNACEVIEQSAFFGTKIKTFELPSTLNFLHPYAFYKCAELETVTMSYFEDEEYCIPFVHCPSLKTINFKGTVAQWQKLEKTTKARNFEFWREDCPNVTVICTDGTVTYN